MDERLRFLARLLAVENADGVARRADGECRLRVVSAADEGTDKVRRGWAEPSPSVEVARWTSYCRRGTERTPGAAAAPVVSDGAMSQAFPSMQLESM